MPGTGTDDIANTAQAAEPIGSTPEQFRAYIQAEIDKWGAVVKTSGAKVD